MCTTEPSRAGTCVSVRGAEHLDCSGCSCRVRRCQAEVYSIKKAEEAEFHASIEERRLLDAWIPGYCLLGSVIWGGRFWPKAPSRHPEQCKLRVQMWNTWVPNPELEKCEEKNEVQVPCGQLGAGRGTEVLVATPSSSRRLRQLRSRLLSKATRCLRHFTNMKGERQLKLVPPGTVSFREGMSRRQSLAAAGPKSRHDQRPVPQVTFLASAGPTAA